MNAEQPPSSEHPEPMPDAPPTAAERHEVDIVVPPQIWVASLADYNNGMLHGVWLNAAQDEAALQTAIDTMLAASPLTAETGEPAEEWAIFDYDGFAPLRIDEHENLSWISRVAQGITQHGPAFAAYADVVEEEQMLDCFDAAYLGHYDSVHAYVEQLVNDLGYDRILDENLPASVRPYVKIDISATAADLLRDLHALPAADGGVWIFK